MTKYIAYLCVWYIYCSFITLIGFITGIILIYKGNNRINSSIIMVIYSIFFPATWYVLYKNRRGDK